jgi:type IV pilus assembly protein PilB
MANSPAELRAAIQGAGVSDLFDIQVLTLAVEQKGMGMEQVAVLASEARSQGISIANHALRLRLITDEDLTQMASQLYGIEPVILSSTDIEVGIATLINADQARLWKVLPYSRNDEGHLLVAVPDPRDFSSRDRIEKALPRETIIFKFAPEDEFNLALASVYHEDMLAGIGGGPEGPQRVVVRDVDPATVRLVKSLIQRASAEGASDVHIEPRERRTEIRFRLDGDLRVAEGNIAKGDASNQIISCIKTMAGMKVEERFHSQDGRIMGSAIGGGDLPNLRVVTLPTVDGEQLHIRLLDQRRARMTLEDLGMTADNLRHYDAAIQKAHGCALITGPTGSGKSTTLYSSVLRVFDRERKFISIEDPVEFRIEGMTQVDTSGHGDQKVSFSEALRAILRSDPDTILLGEIRDSDTAAIAIEAALTGHYLYSTLHTKDALSSITRLHRLGIDPFLIAEAVAVLVAQRLILVLCPECKMRKWANMEFLRNIKAPDWAIARAEDNGDGLEIYKAREGGCATCRGRGYHGRTAVHEVVTMTDELKDMINEGRPLKDLESWARSHDMPSLREDAFRKVVDGQTDLKEMLRIVI